VNETPQPHSAAREWCFRQIDKVQRLRRRIASVDAGSAREAENRVGLAIPQSWRAQIKDRLRELYRDGIAIEILDSSSWSR
jgi:hypothetical protein